LQNNRIITKIDIEGNLNTDSRGIKKLFQFYNKAVGYKNQVIEIDMYKMGFFDANLSCVLYAILYKLNKDNGLKFALDFEYLQKEYSVLFRNGLFIEGEAVDERESTIQLKSFQPNADNDEEFVSYITNDVLGHRGMPNFSRKVKLGIAQELTEISSNIIQHSRTNDPFFVCGQYFPKKNLLNFSIVDIGVGFLPAIREKESKITDHGSAIIWALESGNTTKKDVPGGLGLHNLLKYCEANNSYMQIVSGDKFWNSESMPGFTMSLGCEFAGSVINLLFSDKIR
tara:strand:- start:5393 stop:6244 length:852 start_codon:yes stop_codon:yes gene_type:complete